MTMSWNQMIVARYILKLRKAGLMIFISEKSENDKIG